MDYRSMIGSILDGRYLLISIIGRGGSSVVFNAFDRQDETTVAIKLFNEAMLPPEEVATAKKQFATEIRILSLLSHPNIVGYRGSNLKGRQMYFVMEYADGLTLKEYLTRKKIIPQKEIFDIVCQILSALSHMHERGVVHCDIKPHNIIILPNKKIKITDFGIAQLNGRAPQLPSDKAVGTVYYVSPEQAQGKAPRPESDLYSLGVMLYEAMTNRLPFYHENATEVAKMQISKEPTPPSVYRPDISVGLEQIILRAMEKNTKKRYASAMEMLTDIRALRQNSKTVFGNEKNSSRYRVIERKPLSNVSNISNRMIYPLSEKGASFAENQAYFKRLTSHSGTFTPRSEQFPAHTGSGRALTGSNPAHTGSNRAMTGRNPAVTGKNPAVTGRTQRISSGDIPPIHSQRLPKASNTIAIDEKEIRNLTYSKWLSLCLGIITALILVIAISIGMWFLISPEDRFEKNQTNYSITETEIQWNTEHTEKY